MFAALPLGVCDTLAAGPRTATTLAAELGARPDALGRLPDACVGLALLRRDADRYENTPPAAAYLTRTCPHQLTGYLHNSNAVLWRMWAHLEDAVREGTHRWKQVFGWDGPIFRHPFRDDQARVRHGLHPPGRPPTP
jgi:acetylserotonin N-methyltransferase